MGRNLGVTLWRKVFPPVLSLGIGLAAWEVLGRREPILLDTPRHAVDALVNMAKSGTLWKALGESGLLYGIGLAAAIVLGIAYGLLLARVRLLRDSTEWLVYALQAVPVVGVTPFILAGLGFGVGAKSLVVFLVAVFPILINTIYGAHQTPTTLLEVAKLSRSKEWCLWRDVLLPHTLPFAMAGVSQGIAAAFVGTIAAEFFLNPTGVGGILLLASARFQSATVLGVTILIAVLAVAFIFVGRILEGLASPWRKGVDR